MTGNSREEGTLRGRKRGMLSLGSGFGDAVLSVSLQPWTCTPDLFPGLCPPGKPGCPVPCEQGESSPLPLAAEAESLACCVNCLSITAALLCPGMHRVGCNGPYNLPHPHVLGGMAQH